MTWSFPLPLPLRAAHTKHRQLLFYSALCYISHPANFHPHSRSLCAPRQLLCTQPRVRNWQNIKPSCCWPGEMNYKSVFVFKQRYHWIWNVCWPLRPCMCGKGVVLKIRVNIFAINFSYGPISTNLVFVNLLHQLLKLITGKNAALDFSFLDQLLVVMLPESGLFWCVAKKRCCQRQASCGQQSSWTNCIQWKTHRVMWNNFQHGNYTNNYQNISLELQQENGHFCFLSWSQNQRTALVVRSFFWMYRLVTISLFFNFLFFKIYICFKVYSSFLQRGLWWPSMTLTVPSFLERRKQFSRWHVKEEKLTFSLWGTDCDGSNTRLSLSMS